MRYIFFLTCMLVFGCASLNTMTYKELNQDAFLIKQKTASDIMCIKNKDKKTLCFHVDGKHAEGKGLNDW